MNNAIHPYNKPKPLFKKPTCKTSLIYCLDSYKLSIFTTHVHIPQKEFYFVIFLDYWHWHYYQSPWCKASSNMNLSNVLNVNDYISTKSIPIPENKSHINYSALEPVLFEKFHNIKLSH